jgi:hypothetical protein
MTIYEQQSKQLSELASIRQVREQQMRIQDIDSFEKLVRESRDISGYSTNHTNNVYKGCDYRQTTISQMNVYKELMSVKDGFEVNSFSTWKNFP